MQAFPDKSPPAFLRPFSSKRQSRAIAVPRWAGTLKVSIYPKVSGSISDAQVQAEPENRWSSERNAKTDFEHCRVATEEGKAKYGGAQVATEDMLTPDLLSWTLGATVGIKYSKQFFQSLRFVKAA